jgi:hypothetical protein
MRLIPRMSAIDAIEHRLPGSSVDEMIRPKEHPTMDIVKFISPSLLPNKISFTANERNNL